jgi:dTDP-4-amino-4,6-dideoxygalactose transaminase
MVNNLKKVLNAYMPKLPNINDVLYSGNLSFGKYSQLFQDGVSKLLGLDKLLLVSDYSNSIFIGLKVLGLKPGDEILMSPLNCLANSVPYLQYGLKIRFVDIDFNSGNLSIKALKKRITPSSKLIVASNFAGNTSDIDGIRQLCQQNHLKLIIDNFENFNPKSNANKLLSNDEVILYSFGPTKIPNALGSAAIAFYSKNQFETAKHLSDLGIDRTKFRLPNGEINPNLDIIQIGFSAMTNEVSSYIAFEQLKDYDSLISKAKTNFNFLEINLSKMVQSQVTVLKSDQGCNYWVFGFLCSRKEEISKLLKEKYNLSTSTIHYDLSRYSLFENKEPNDRFPNLDKFLDSYIAIPCGWWIDEY